MSTTHRHLAHVVASSSVTVITAVLVAFTCIAADVVHAQSPTATMKAYHEAAKSKDVAALRQLLSSAYLEELKKAPVPAERVLAALTENVPPSLPEMRNEKITGDRATLELRDHQTKRWETIAFVRENGAWKVAPR